jgi:hypothetical protein
MGEDPIDQILVDTGSIAGVQITEDDLKELRKTYKGNVDLAMDHMFETIKTYKNTPLSLKKKLEIKAAYKVPLSFSDTMALSENASLDPSTKNDVSTATGYYQITKTNHEDKIKEIYNKDFANFMADPELQQDYMNKYLVPGYENRINDLKKEFDKSGPRGLLDNYKQYMINGRFTDDQLKAIQHVLGDAGAMRFISEGTTSSPRAKRDVEKALYRMIDIRKNFGVPTSLADQYDFSKVGIGDILPYGIMAAGKDGVKTTPAKQPAPKVQVPFTPGEAPITEPGGPLMLGIKLVDPTKPVEPPKKGETKAKAPTLTTPWKAVGIESPEVIQPTSENDKSLNLQRHKDANKKIVEKDFATIDTEVDWEENKNKFVTKSKFDRYNPEINPKLPKEIDLDNPEILEARDDLQQIVVANKDKYESSLFFLKEEFGENVPNDINNAFKKNSTLINEIESLQNKIKEKYKSIPAPKEEIATYSKQRADLKDRIIEIDADLETINSQLGELNNRLQKAAEDPNITQEQFNAIKNEVTNQFDDLSGKFQFIANDRQKLANEYNNTIQLEKDVVKKYEDSISQIQGAYDKDPLVQQFDTKLKEYQKNWEQIDKYQKNPYFNSYIQSGTRLSELDGTYKYLFPDKVDYQKRSEDLRRLADSAVKGFDPKYLGVDSTLTDVWNALRNIVVDGPATGPISTAVNTLKGYTYNVIGDVVATAATISDIVGQKELGRKLRVGDLYGINSVDLQGAEQLTKSGIRSDWNREFLDDLYTVRKGDTELQRLGLEEGDKVIVENGIPISYRDADGFVKDLPLLMGVNREAAIKQFLKGKDDKIETDWNWAAGATTTLPSVLDFAALIAFNAAAAPRIAATKLGSRVGLKNVGRATTFGYSSFQQYGDIYNTYLEKGLDPSTAAKYALGETAGVSLIELFGGLELRILKSGSPSAISTWTKVRDTSLDLFARGKIGTKDFLAALSKGGYEVLKQIVPENAEEIVQGEYSKALQSIATNTEYKPITLNELGNTVYSTVLITLFPAVSQGIDTYRKAKADTYTTALYNTVKYNKDINKDIEEAIRRGDITQEQGISLDSYLNYIKDELSEYENITDVQGAAITGLIGTRSYYENKMKNTNNSNAKELLKGKIDEINASIQEVLKNKDVVEVDPSAAPIVGEDSKEAQDKLDKKEGRETVTTSKKGFVTEDEFNEIEKTGKLPEGITYAQFQELPLEQQQSYRETASSSTPAAAAKLAGELQRDIEKADEIEKIDKRAQRLQAILDNDAALVEEGEESLIGEDKKKALQDELNNLKTRKDAIQKQSAAAVPVQPGAKAGPGVGGQVQAEPEVTTGEGKAKVETETKGKAKGKEKVTPAAKETKPTDIKTIDNFSITDSKGKEIAPASFKRDSKGGWLRVTPTGKTTPVRGRAAEQLNQEAARLATQETAKAAPKATEVKAQPAPALQDVESTAKALDEKKLSLDEKAKKLGYLGIKQFNVQNQLGENLNDEEKALLQEYSNFQQEIKALKDENVIAKLSDEEFSSWAKANDITRDDVGRVVRDDEVELSAKRIRILNARGDSKNAESELEKLKESKKKDNWTIESWKERFDEDIKQSEIDDINSSNKEFNKSVDKAVESILSKEQTATSQTALSQPAPEAKGAKPTPAAEKTKETPTKTTLEQTGKTKKQIVDQIYKFFTSKIPGLSEADAREFAEVNYNMWKAVADTLGGNKGLEYIRQKVSMIGTISTKDMTGKGIVKEVTNYFDKLRKDNKALYQKYPDLDFILSRLPGMGAIDKAVRFAKDSFYTPQEFYNQKTKELIGGGELTESEWNAVKNTLSNEDKWLIHYIKKNNISPSKFKSIEDLRRFVESEILRLEQEVNSGKKHILQKFTKEDAQALADAYGETGNQDRAMMLDAVESAGTREEILKQTQQRQKDSFNAQLRHFREDRIPEGLQLSLLESLLKTTYRYTQSIDIDGRVGNLNNYTSYLKKSGKTDAEIEDILEKAKLDGKITKKVEPYKRTENTINEFDELDFGAIEDISRNPLVTNAINAVYNVVLNRKTDKGFAKNLQKYKVKKLSSGSTLYKMPKGDLDAAPIIAAYSDATKEVMQSMPWCTSGESKSESVITNGDVYVVLDKDNTPIIQATYNEDGTLEQLGGVGSNQSIRIQDSDDVQEIINDVPESKSELDRVRRDKLLYQVSKNDITSISREDAKWLLTQAPQGSKYEFITKDYETFKNLLDRSDYAYIFNVKVEEVTYDYTSETKVLLGYLDTYKKDISKIIYFDNNLQINDPIIKEGTFAEGVVFNRLVSFNDSVIQKGGIPKNTIFPYKVYFYNTTLSSDAITDDVVFNGGVEFEGAELNESSIGENVKFDNFVRFSNSLVKKGAFKKGLEFNGSFEFYDSKIEKGALPNGTIFRGFVKFIGGSLYLPDNVIFDSSYVDFEDFKINKDSIPKGTIFEKNVFFTDVKLDFDYLKNLIVKGDVVIEKSDIFGNIDLDYSKYNVGGDIVVKESYIEDDKYQNDFRISSEELMDDLEEASNIQFSQQAAPEQLQEVAERIVNNAIDHLQDIVKRDMQALKKEKDPARRKEIQQSIKTNQNTVSQLQKARKDPRFQEADNQFRGATIALANGSSVVASLSSPSPTTLPHEGIFHSIIEDAMTPEEQTAFIEEYNREFGDNATEWNTDVSEYTARTYEKYLSNGRKLTAAEVPNTKRRNILQQAFDKFTELVKDFYNGIIEYNNTKGVTKKIELSPQAQAFFDRVTGIATQPPSQAAAEVELTAEQQAEADAEAKAAAEQEKMEPKDQVQKDAIDLINNPDASSVLSEDNLIKITEWMESIGLNTNGVKKKCK